VPLPPGQAETWRFTVVHQGRRSRTSGPFVMDYAHPLTEGLMFEGIVWSAGPGALGGGSQSVIAAGNVPLLSDAALPNGAHDLRLRLRLDLSNVQRSPNWPILFWNLLAWRAAEFDGPAAANVRLGAEAQLMLPHRAPGVEVTDPDGHKLPMPFTGRQLALPRLARGLPGARRRLAVPVCRRGPGPRRLGPARQDQRALGQ